MEGTKVPPLGIFVGGLYYVATSNCAYDPEEEISSAYTLTPLNERLLESTLD